MNKKTLVIASSIAGLLLVGGGVFAYSADQSNKVQEKMAMEKTADSEAMMKQDSATTEKDTIAKEGDSMTNDATMTKGIYTDYDQAKLANAQHGDVVLFFYAPWCPTCRDADKNFNASATPDGLTLLKTDYDSSNDLKKKYGVTYQHTFVQVDAGGNLIKKWSGSSNYDAIKSELN